jgi:UDPglucose 6-dehydrogenase
MKIAVIGTGYVGLCSGVGLASRGNDVVCVGRNREKIDSINRGIPPIFEEGLEEMLKDLTSKGRLKATDDLENAVKEAEATFICVGTPSDESGKIDLSQMETAARQLGRALKEMNTYHVFAVKSTVVPGTTEKIAGIIEEVSGKMVCQDFGVCMNPEFLREGKALEDFLKPDRIVIGEIDRKSGDVLEEIYTPFEAPVLRTDLKTAEMIKYASNSLLAAKISFSNEIGNMCKRLGIDVYDVMKGVGMDHRFNPRFLDAGLGFGGSCFPKDVSAIVEAGKSLGCSTEMLESVLKVNKSQPLRIIDILKKRLPDLKGKTIAVLGLAFKPGTDDIREAPSIKIAERLLEEGASVNAWDPKAEKNFRKKFPSLNYFSDFREAIKGSDACLLVTEWPELASLEDRDFGEMKNRIIIEGRKILDRKKVSRFEGVCW